MRFRARPLRVRRWGLALPATAIALLGSGFSSAPAQASSVAPMVSAVSTPSDSWITLRMGDLSDPANTFWELFHNTPGSSAWSLVTPPGVADNGGLVESASGGSVVVGFVPSGLLRFSPLAASAHNGASWAPSFLPGALAPLPDALAAASPGGAIALLSGGRALSGTADLTSWTSLVTATALSRVSPGCGVVGLDGATLLPGGVPLIATGCRRGGQVGLFTRTAGTWQRAQVTLGGVLRGAATFVLRVQSMAATTAVLALATQHGRRFLVALWQSGAAPWTVAKPVALGSGASVRSTALDPGGDVAILLGGRTGSPPVAMEVTPAGQWMQLPRPPTGTTALALPAGAPVRSGPDIDAFTVAGDSLGVFSLAAPGRAWMRVQSNRIPLSYGSSG